MAERRKSNRPSKIDALPKDLRDLIERLRADGATIDQIIAHLGEMDVEVSRSGMGRHIIEIDDMIADARKAKFEAAEVARALKEEGNVDLSALNRELLEGEFFRFMKSLRALNLPVDPDTLKALASGANSLSKARATEAELRRQADAEAEKRLKARLDKIVDKAAKDAPGGLTKDIVNAIKAEILGVKT